jgi:pimeloyl-ACP methyl ester carboxylesterase
MVLIHGLGADHRCWAPVLGSLAERFDVIAVDLPGFGDSPLLPDDDPPRPARLAQITGELLAGLGVGRAHLVGNSLGAWIALEAAAQGLAASVTSLCAAGLWPHPLLSEVQAPRRAARRLAQLAGPALMPLARTALGRRALFAPTLRDASKLTAQQARALMHTWLYAPGYDAANLWMRRGRFTAWDQIDAPVTLAWGDHDRMVRAPRNVPEGVVTTTLRGCGHLPMWDAPEVVVEAIMDTTGRARARPSPATSPA